MEFLRRLCTRGNYLERISVLKEVELRAVMTRVSDKRKQNFVTVAVFERVRGTHVD